MGRIAFRPLSGATYGEQSFDQVMGNGLIEQSRPLIYVVQRRVRVAFGHHDGQNCASSAVSYLVHREVAFDLKRRRTGRGGAGHNDEPRSTFRPAACGRSCGDGEVSYWDVRYIFHVWGGNVDHFKWTDWSVQGTAKTPNIKDQRCRIDAAASPVENFPPCKWIGAPIRHAPGSPNAIERPQSTPSKPTPKTSVSLVELVRFTHNYAIRATARRRT